MRFKFFLTITILLAICSTTCSRNNTRRAHKKNQTQSGIIGQIEKGSKFSKLKIGMSKRQVTDLIGIFNDHKTYTTGKAWIPFYYGRDSVRQEFIYKNEGRLIFGGDERLLKIVADRSEDGYR